MPKVTQKSHRRFPLDAVFGSVGNVRVLRALVVHGGALSVGRLAKETSMTAQGVRLALDSLTTLGIVRVLGQQRSRLYQVAEDHPWARHVRRLFQAEQAMGERFVARTKAVLQKNEDVLAAWLYGSVARGTDNSMSDVDVAVVMREGHGADALREELDRLGRELRAAYSVVILTEGELKEGTVSPGWWASVMADGRCLKGDWPREQPLATAASLAGTSGVPDTNAG